MWSWDEVCEAAARALETNQEVDKITPEMAERLLGELIGELLAA